MRYFRTQLWAIPNFYHILYRRRGLQDELFLELCLLLLLQNMLQKSRSRMSNKLKQEKKKRLMASIFPITTMIMISRGVMSNMARENYIAAFYFLYSYLHFGSKRSGNVVLYNLSRYCSSLFAG